MDLLYFLLEWDFSVVRLVLWQMKSVIPFAGVQVLCGGASGVASEVWDSLLESVLRFVSLIVQPI